MIDKLQSDLQNAQRSRDSLKVSTLRLLLAEIHNSEIAKTESLSEQEIIGIIQREIKKRREAAAGFMQGKRPEQALKEEDEADILSNYLPKQLSDEELTKIVKETITEVGAEDVADMGKVIGMVMGKAKGAADGARVSALVKEKLQ